MFEKLLHKIEIIPSLIPELKNAEYEIIMTLAWIKEEILFDILLEKQRQGIKVKIVIDNDNSKNKNKYFELLKAGGQIYKTETSTFSIISNKYCIIDNRIAIVSTKNWSANLLINNRESVIITNQSATVQNFKNIFRKTRRKSKRIRKIDFNYSRISRILSNLLNGFAKNEKANPERVELQKEYNIIPEDSFKSFKIEKIISEDYSSIFHNWN